MNLKIIIGLLVGLIVLQIIGAIIFFSLPAKDGSVLPQPIKQGSSDTSSSSGGKITLTTDHPQLKVGDLVAVSVMIDTDNKMVDGVDISLQYDPKLLDPVLVNDQAFVPGRLFPDVPFNAYDLRAGTASMSAISTMNKNFIGTGTMSVISFKAKTAGVTTVKVVSEPGNTTDSNMVADGREILNETNNVELTITR